MRTLVKEAGHVADGVKSVRYEGYSSHALPSPHGLVVEPSIAAELILVRFDGNKRRIGGKQGGWCPRDAGIAIQVGTAYYLASYDRRKRILKYQDKIPWALRCCATGFVKRDENEFFYVPFEGDGISNEVLLYSGQGVNQVVPDGLVIYNYDARNWLFASITGETRLIYNDVGDRWRFNSGMACNGFIWVHGGHEMLLYHYDGREPARTKYAGCGGCSRGIVANFEARVVVYHFGGGEQELWTGSYDKWIGSCDAGLFITRGDEAFLLPYSGEAPKLLWQGPFEDLRPFDEGAIFKNPKELVYVPLPG